MTLEITLKIGLAKKLFSIDLKEILRFKRCAIKDE